MSVRRIVLDKHCSVETQKVGDTWTVLVSLRRRVLTHRIPVEAGRGWDEDTASTLANKVWAKRKIDPDHWVEL